MFDSCSSVFKKLEKEFEAKTSILGRIQHSNIVKLLYCISSEDSKLLAYESWRMGAWTAGSMGRQTEGLIRTQVGLELEGWIGRRGSRLQLGLLKSIQREKMELDAYCPGRAIFIFQRCYMVIHGNGMRWKVTVVD
ncbi:hypothetical protein AAC387_Pa05g2853 [Persea americana]